MGAPTMCLGRLDARLPFNPHIFIASAYVCLFSLSLIQTVSLYLYYSHTFSSFFFCPCFSFCPSVCFLSLSLSLPIHPSIHLSPLPFIIIPIFPSISIPTSTLSPSLPLPSPCVDSGVRSSRETYLRYKEGKEGRLMESINPLHYVNPTFANRGCI